MSLSERIAAISSKAAGVATAPSLDERRTAWRKSSIIAASIVSDRLQGSVSCIVRDLSATGARVAINVGRSSVIQSPAGLPPTFKMLLDREEIEVDCALQWTSAGEAGVRFLGGMRHLPKKPRKLTIARKC